ncbi:MAG: Crp/Fnr family transcriptional regulator [Chloroflexi bacterium]|nr:Crp/Fnr family transcriptional regulator [Chloroflexota bacterium]
MTATMELLRTACYFSKLDPAALEDIRRLITERKLPSGETILWEGQEADVLYFVISGVLKLFATSAEGREFVVRLVYGGDSVNDDAILGNGINALSAMTMSPVLLYGLHQGDLSHILRAYPQVNSNIALVLAVRQRHLVRLATELVFKNVTARLARFLLEQEKLERAGAKEVRVTQQEMAAMIGTVRELVNRSLRELEAMGAIRLKHNQIIIADKKRLTELSSL